MIKRTLQHYLFLAGALLPPFFVHANDYLTAKQAIASGAHIDEFKSLETHPLYPYLAYDYYKSHLEQDKSITELFETHHDAPATQWLHDDWITRQFDNGEYKKLISHYYDTGDEASHCAYLSALYLTGNKETALAGIDSIWLSPRSVSNYCDTIFAAWPSSQDPAYLLKRTRLAYHAGNNGFASTLAKKLPEPEQATILQFIAFKQSPTNLLNHSPKALTATPLHKDLLPTALERLVRINSVKYTPFALQFEPLLYDNHRYQDMLATLLGFLVNRKDSQSLTVFERIKQPDIDAIEHITRYLVITQQWQKLIALTTKAADNANSDFIQYWQGRAYQALDQNKKATEAFKRIASHRSYYGFLAADQLGSDYDFNYEPIQANPEQQRNLSNNQSLIRAQAFTQLGDDVGARREILSVAEKLAPPMSRQLAYWLNQHHYHHEAIIVLGRLREWNDIRIRFPAPYNAITAQANQRFPTIDKPLIYAIIRQESSMNPRAISHAKAQGLMQLIPGTANKMARAHNMSLSGNQIFNPEINVYLGTAYLERMLNQFGHIALAAAAYNAGPGRVEDWLAFGTTDMTLWIENIPFNETRKYVKRILEYKQTYAHNLQTKTPRVSSWLAQTTLSN